MRSYATENNLAEKLRELIFRKPEKERNKKKETLNTLIQDQILIKFIQMFRF